MPDRLVDGTFVWTRVSGRLMGALAMTVIAALAVVGFHAVHSHQRSAHAASYRRGEHVLHALALPSGVIDTSKASLAGIAAGCRPAPDTRCLHTTVMVSAVHPLLTYSFGTDITLGLTAS
jgi:hypothetical protein